MKNQLNSENKNSKEISKQVYKDLIDKLEQEKFFGDLVTIFKEGKIVFIRKVQCYQPKDEGLLLAK
ncbi:MAG: hypothetical protein AB1349_01480 [Elusimicrobiota bacterium]